MNDKVLFIGYERVKRMNKGTKRLFIVLSYVLSSIPVVYFFFVMFQDQVLNKEDYLEVPPLIEYVYPLVVFVLISVSTYFIFWSIINLCLWIIEGYKSESKE